MTYENNDLHTACESNDLKKLQHLIQKVKNLDSKNSFGKTPLHLACFSLNKDMVRTLIKAGADLNAQDNDGNTALYICAALGDIEIAKLLIDNGADISSLDQYSCNLLHQCAVADNYELAEILCNKIPVDKVDKFGNTPLCAALFYGSDKTAALFVEKDADINLKNIHDLSPRDLINDRLEDLAC